MGDVLQHPAALEVYDDGGPVEVAGPRVRSLFAWLLISARAAGAGASSARARGFGLDGRMLITRVREPAGLPPRRSLPGLFKRLRARGPRRWRRWQRVNAPGLDYFAGMGQSNIESFRLAADDPDAVAVKAAAIAAAMLKATADDLLEQWATILWPTDGAVVSGVYRLRTRHAGFERRSVLAGGCGAAIRRVVPGLPGRAARCGGHR